MPAKLHFFPDEVALAKAAAANWIGQLEARAKTPAANNPYAVALSGGRIAKTFFSEIARQAAGRIGLFARVHFFWADERCVLPTDSESNYAIARELLFKPLNLPDAQIHRLRGEENEALALRDALENIKMWARDEKGQPIFDMIFLGMGEDGHVASLFPGESEEVINDPAICRAVTAVKPPPRRLTLGYRVIVAATKVWVLVSGAGKQGALKESLQPNGKTPLAGVLKQRQETEIFSDIEP